MEEGRNTDSAETEAQEGYVTFSSNFIITARPCEARYTCHDFVLERKRRAKMFLYPLGLLLSSNLPISNVYAYIRLAWIHRAIFSSF
jgi:hypothetical protein